VSDLGPVSASLYAELRELARQRGIVVWLDKEGSYTAFADALAARSAADPTALPVRRFRGSYLELMLALEDVQDGVAMTPLLIHVPGHNEDSIAETPLFEVYRAGRRHRHALDTLVRDAAHGLATPAAIDAFLATPGFTLDDADRWLARQVAGAAAGAGSGGPDLSLHTAEALYDDLVSRGPVARELERPEAVAAVWRRAEVLLGLTEDARRQLLIEAEGSARRASSPAELASDAATALAGWALCVEFVHDLRRAPADPWLAIAQHLPKAAVAACQKLAVHLRRRHDRQYASIAASVEDLVPLEVATATADDLGKIDTFEFEDAKVLAAALDALMIADNQRALALATARTSGKSFWTTYDPRRRIAWHLIELAARLGSSVVDRDRLLAGCTTLAEAVARYTDGGYQVDRAHRKLEQAREELPHLDIPEAATLRRCLDQLRGVYRRWADDVALAWSALGQREGFLPPASLQQRTLFEDLVVPRVDEGLTAYVMVDALRFEMGQELADSLRDTRTADVELTARLAELPTITEVGMNALAPVARDGKLTVDYKDGKILGFRVGNLRVDGPETRRRAINDRLGGEACPKLSLEEVCERDAASLRKALTRARAVVVHAEGIDKAGEKGVGLAVFERELQKLRAAWRVLYEAGVKRFVFTADHGFALHDVVTRVAVSHGKLTDPQRRHVFLAHRRDQAGEVCIGASDLGYDGATFWAAFPAGIDPFDRGARAKDFVHGGPSLQERVIPVVTVRHRYAAGGDKASYEIAARAGLAVAGMHCLIAKVQTAKQANLVYGGQAEVELALESADDEAVSVELCDVHHARRTGAGVIATVDQEFQVFFRLTGDVETRAAVRLRPATRALDVAPAVTAERFQIVLRARPAQAPTVVAPAAPVPAGPAVADWLADVPEGVRAVFRHLSEHGSINEAEATQLLGGPRQFRTFSRDLDQYRRRAPFAIRVEVASGIKCYVRGEPESS
jgi:hypothetical protein